MKSWTEQKLYVPNHPLISQYISSDDLFLDIETTGLSKTRHQVYIIGMMQLVNHNTSYVNQLFTENEDKESEMLSYFLKLLMEIKPRRIITFNGNRFDLPFLVERAKKYNIDLDFSQYKLFDIYKEVSRLKNLLQLPNYKQKTVEQFLGIHREDRFSGGDLIKIYKDFCKAPDPQKLELLKLHNYEDVLDMLDLIPIFAYERLLNQPPVIHSYSAEKYQDLDGRFCEELIVELIPPYPLQGHVLSRNSYSDTYVHVDNSNVLIRIPILNGYIRHFYPDYKNYYYLPAEDIAIHKSVAAYVDPSHREKATPKNCYTKVPLSDNFLASQQFSEYISHVLQSYL